jgi:hypothetical protein
VRVVVLVEGESDRRALDTLAARRGRDLAAEGVEVVPMGGATSIGHFLARHAGPDVRFAGLCDAGEERMIRRALERAAVDGRDFYVCHVDLEDELIRALGPSGVQAVIEAMGDGPRWLKFSKQPAQLGRPIEARLLRFMGTTSGRKALYAEAMVAALDAERVPPPLDALLAAV